MLNILRTEDIFTSACHTRGDAATMSELSELFFAKMGEMVGSPIPARDPMHDFVRIEDAPDPDIRPGDAEDAMIALIDAKRAMSPNRRRAARRKARLQLAAI